MKTKVVLSAVALLCFILMFEQCKHEPTVTVTGDNNFWNNQIPPDYNTGDSVCFNSQILPLINSTCNNDNCHNAVGHQNGYIFTTYANIAKYATTIKTVTNNNSMPYRLTAWTSAQKALFAKWISQGAKDVECSTSACDTSNVTYTASIQPILSTYCVGCHYTSNQSGAVNLDNYNSVKTSALSGHLLCSVNMTSGCYAMPKGISILTFCNRRKFAIWASKGCPQ